MPLTTGICCLSMFATFGDDLSCSGSYLYHQQTVEFNGYAYHLTVEKEYANDPGWEVWRVHLFECDPTGEICEVAHTAYDRYDDPDAALIIDTQANELRMIVEGEQVFAVMVDK